jgi:hypothetical protein
MIRIRYRTFVQHRTSDVRHHDVGRTLLRTTLYVDIVLVRWVRATSYVYELVRHDVRHRTPTSVLYDIVRLTYDIVRWQKSRWWIP